MVSNAEFIVLYLEWASRTFSSRFMSLTCEISASIKSDLHSTVCLPWMTMEIVPRGDWGVETVSKQLTVLPMKNLAGAGAQLAPGIVSERMSRHKKSQRSSWNPPRGLSRTALFKLSLPRNYPEDLLEHRCWGPAPRVSESATLEWPRNLHF